MTDPSQYFKGRTVQEQMDEVIGYVDTRAAEVATTAIAGDVAQVHQDMLDADADASAAAASAAAAAVTLANAVKKTGESSQSIAGDVAVAGTLSGGVITGTQVTVPAPVNNTDAASKKYVDDQDATKIGITAINTYAVGLTGNQNYTGVKTAVDIHNALKATSPNFVQGASADSGYNVLIERVADANDTAVFQRYTERTSTNNRTYRQILSNKTLDNHLIVAYLDTRINNDGTVSMLLIKTVDGVEAGRVQLANITS